MTNREINSNQDFIRIIHYILTIITLLNLTITFLFIHIYLRLKHSKSIAIAERSNMTRTYSLISFRKLVLGFLCMGYVVYTNFQNHYSDPIKDNSKIPPLCIIICLLGISLSLLYLFSKKTIVSFLRRKISTLTIPGPQVSSRQTQQEQVAGKRRVRHQAWT